MRLLLLMSTPSHRLAWEARGFVIEHTDSIEEGEHYAETMPFDAIVLHKKTDAQDFVSRMRRIKNTVPIAVINEFNEDEFELAVLDAGADAVIRSRSHDVLAAHLRAIVRRRHGLPESTIEIGPLVLNMTRKVVTAHGQMVKFTSKEYELFESLALKRDSVVTKEMFLMFLYNGNDEPMEKIIDVYVCKIRKKLSDFGLGGMIETVWGRGYMLNSNFATAPSIVPEVGEMVS